jgi:hypothetical protein
MASERARQQRLERKARRRREKRERPQQRAAPLLVSFGTGLPKISETLVAFAEPLLAGIPEAEAGWRTGLYAAAIVWNGVVAGIPEAEITGQLQRGFGSPVDVPGLVRRLIERKQSLFADDSRFIFDVRTQQSGDRVHVMAASGLAR